MKGMERVKTYVWANAYALRCRVTQAMSTTAAHPVAAYADLDAIAKALLRVEYLADTADVVGAPAMGKRKLDFARHPSQVQRGVDLGTEEHKVRVGDCEDYALYWLAAGLKSGLVTEARAVCAGWTWAGGESVCHVVAAFRALDADWWAGNWNRGAPILGDAVAGMVERTKRPMDWAVDWRAELQRDDSVKLTAARVLL